MTFHQIFRTSIGLTGHSKPSYFGAFKAVEIAVEQLNDMLQHQLSQKRLVQHGDPDFQKEPVVVIDPVIVGMEIRFLRDTGHFNGCTGEIDGQYEDRFHALILDVEFQDP